MSSSPPIDKVEFGQSNIGLSGALRRLADELLDQQLWFIGQDIRHPDGNALLAYGCERWRAPQGCTGATAYLPPCNAGSVVWWGFGAAGWDHPADSGGAAVMVERHAFGPRLLTRPLALPLWRIEQLPPRVFPRTPDQWRVAWSGVTVLVYAFIRYERWAVASLGAPHRLRVAAARPRDVRRTLTVPATELADAWESFLLLGWRQVPQRLPAIAPASGRPAAP